MPVEQGEGFLLLFQREEFPHAELDGSEDSFASQACVCRKQFLFLHVDQVFGSRAQCKQLVTHLHKESPGIGLVGQWLEKVAFEFRFLGIAVPPVQFGPADAAFAEHEADADVETYLVDDPAVFLHEGLGVGFALDELQCPDGPLDLDLVSLGDQLLRAGPGFREIPAQFPDGLFEHELRAIGGCRHQSARHFPERGFDGAGRFHEVVAVDGSWV